MLYAIELANVSKQIDKYEILNNINLQVPVGKIFGITGVNGSGKSMLLRIICGLVLPTSGLVTVLGQQIGKDVEFSQDIGAIIDTPGFLPRYTGLQNLELLAMIRNKITKSDIVDTLKRVGLDVKNKRPFRTYSTGMRQRLGIAQAIMEKPRVILLDEPTRGIDQAGTNELHDLFKEINATGVTILLTSHAKAELELLCNEVFHIENGSLYQSK